MMQDEDITNQSPMTDETDHEDSQDSFKEQNAAEALPHDKFTNDQVFVSHLPKHEDIIYEKKQTASLYVGYVVLGIMALIALIIVAMVGFFNEDFRPYFLWVMALVVLAAAFIAYAEYRSFFNSGYATREHDLLSKSGWLWQSVIVVPYNKIQHVEVHQGPIDRLFDLSSITVFTAGGSASDVEIDGILPSQAEAIKAYLQSKNKSVLSPSEALIQEDEASI